MKVSKEKIEAVLSRFSVLFTYPVATVSSDKVFGIWSNLFKDVEEEDFNRVTVILAKSLHQFPVPADYFELLEDSPAIKEATQ